ncbi:hypothetical protein TNCV_3407431 [Trichonephila clavipes]|nr:hypothetical protein TNCV_3407431 [Trichonephila clavipes]
MIVCPQKLLPTLSHLCAKLLYAVSDNKCRIGPLAGAPPDTCGEISAPRDPESGFITEDDTSPAHTQVVRGRQKPVVNALRCGVMRLSDAGSRQPSKSLLVCFS